MFSNRLAIAAAVVVLLATSALAINRIASVGPPGPSPTPTIELPPARTLTPTAVIGLAGQVNDTIPLTTDGTDLWVGVDGAVIHIDGKTNATRRVDVADMSTGNGNIAITPEGLWIEDNKGNRIEQIDPVTGAVQRTVEVSSPLWIQYTDDQLWMGPGGGPAAYLLDRANGKLGPPVGSTNVFSIGLGNVWSGRWDGIEGEHQRSDLITRYDATTGVVVGTISVPPGTGCQVTGSFPDNVWAGCPADFGTCPANRIAVRIDPATNRVVTTAKICGNPVVVIDGTPWFLVGRKDGQDNAHSLVSVDPATGQLLAQYDLGTIDPDVVVLTDTAVWMSDEHGNRVVRYDLTGLHE